MIYILYIVILVSSALNMLDDSARRKVVEWIVNTVMRFFGWVLPFIFGMMITYEILTKAKEYDLIDIEEPEKTSRSKERGKQAPLEETEDDEDASSDDESDESTEEYDEEDDEDEEEQPVRAYT